MGYIVLLDLLICWLDRIVLAGLYCWIISYRLDWIGWIQLDCIILYRLDEDISAFMHWQVTARMVRMERIDCMGHWWDGGGTGGR